MLWTWDKRRSFFNPRAEIRPPRGIESRTSRECLQRYTTRIEAFGCRASVTREMLRPQRVARGPGKGQNQQPQYWGPTWRRSRGQVAARPVEAHVPSISAHVRLIDGTCSVFHCRKEEIGLIYMHKVLDIKQCSIFICI